MDFKHGDLIYILPFLPEENWTAADPVLMNYDKFVTMADHFKAKEFSKVTDFGLEYFKFQDLETPGVFLERISLSDFFPETYAAFKESDEEDGEVSCVVLFKGKRYLVPPKYLELADDIPNG